MTAEVAPGFDRRTLVVAGHGERSGAELDWADAVVVVRTGTVDLECRHGGHLVATAGAVLCNPGVVLERLRNLGADPATLVCTARRSDRVARALVDAQPRGRTVVHARVSMDGFVLDATDPTDPAVRPLVDVPIRWQTGAMLVGRRTYERAGGWGGVPPTDEPWFVVAERAGESGDDDRSAFAFVVGLDSALRAARAAAGPLDVGVLGPEVARPLVAAGEVDEVHLERGPVPRRAGPSVLEALGIDPASLRLVGSATVDGTTHLAFRL